jgi:hypothetical protein
MQSQQQKNWEVEEKKKNLLIESVTEEQCFFFNTSCLKFNL